MLCPKCKGLMVNERLTDYAIVFNAWRCVNCGTILDSTILENRKAKKKEKTKRKYLRKKAG